MYTFFFITLISAISLHVFITASFAAVQFAGPVMPVPAIQQRHEWDRFIILIWQYQTLIKRDFPLYRKLGLHGFHVDRGFGARDIIEFSLTHHLPYYVDHTADKGFLYLKRNAAHAVTGKLSLTVRPHSLADPQTIATMKAHILRNIDATRRGLVLAYAFDDEISLGSFAIPCDVDVHPFSLVWFREWLRHEYGTIGRLNKQWNTSFGSFEDVVPQGFEQVRKRNRKPPLSEWNLSPWVDFRHFMDFQFAAVLSELTRYANSIDPRTPAGFVGGQGPGPWGGYDYAMLSRAVQWMEAYDIHGNNEILRSFWNRDRRPRMQTFSSTQNPKLDSWFLWYYLLHGNQAVIAWPEGWFRQKDFEIAPYVLADKATFGEIQGRISEPLVNPESKFDPDPIGIYYSHPSIQVGWAMDAITHGKSWINRKGSIDDENQTKGVLRKVWCKTLEDLGYQYDFISYLDVRERSKVQVQRYKVIILPRTISLSAAEASALRRYVEEGGTLIADSLCGLMDEHGKGRAKGVLDDVFGLNRDESVGYMNGKGLTEIDGEKYQQPFLQRIRHYNGAYRHNGIVVFERGTKHKPGGNGIEIKDILGLVHRCSVLIKNRVGKGQAVYLNLSPVEYWDSSRRFSEYGRGWREIVSGILAEAGLRPRVTVSENANVSNMIECLYWKNSNKSYLGLVKNPTDRKDLAIVAQKSTVQGITGHEVEISLEFNAGIVGLINLRTNEHLGVGKVFRDKFKPWEGNLYEIVHYSNESPARKR